MAVREYWEIKWLEWINVQKDWVTEVSLTDTLNFVGWWSVTDVGWVATINIPQWDTWYREDVTAGSATSTFVNSPATTTSFLVFTDSGTLMFLWVDYTYDATTETITFLSLGNNEAAYIWVAHAIVQWWGIGDMVKAVYDPTNINSSAFDMDNFIDGTNKHYVSTSEKGLISTALQPGDNVSDLVNDAWYITSASLPTKTSDLQNDSWYITSADVPTKTSELQNDSGFLTSRGYIGTTAVQASSASQNLTGIGNLTMSGNLTITPGNTDNFITFSYSSGTTYSWRLGYLGSGSGDANYLVIQSAKAAGTSWNNVIRMGNETLDAAFGGNVYPITTNAQTLGTADYQWSHIYGVKGTYTGDLTLYTASGDSPAIVFHRGNLGSDTTVDWRMYVTAGHLKLQNAQSGFNSGAWSDVLHFEGD